MYKKGPGGAVWCRCCAGCAKGRRKARIVWVLPALAVVQSVVQGAGNCTTGSGFLGLEMYNGARLNRKCLAGILQGEFFKRLGNGLIKQVI